MLQWSKYNRLFFDKRFGYFLYNALSNSFFELDQEHFSLLTMLKEGGKLSSETKISPHFFSVLRDNKIIVKDDENDRVIKTKRQNRDLLVKDKTNLFLTICPTLGCNFRCAYCFETDQMNGKRMKDEVINQLVHFIKGHKEAKTISICWFGGEPTMVFDVVIKITTKIKELELNFNEASIITNGYLLTTDKISKLNDLNINHVQVTIDGNKEIHDARRFLVGGYPTYERILTNIDRLMNSEYRGSCSIRVNVDKSNYKVFPVIREYLLDRYEGKKVTVYAGRLEVFGNMNCSSCGCLDAHEWTDFSLDIFHNIVNTGKEGVYPEVNIENLCTANKQNSYVIGHLGELYKCWEDVGKDNMVIGSIFENTYTNNPDLIFQYSDGTNPYLNKECLECTVLPICGGGCANRMLRSKFFCENEIEYCSLYKENLEKYLMEYYEEFITMQFYQALTVNDLKIDNSGYRLISPMNKRDNEKVTCA